MLQSLHDFVVCLLSLCAYLSYLIHQDGWNDDNTILIANNNVPRVDPQIPSELQRNVDLAGSGERVAAQDRAVAREQRQSHVLYFCHVSEAPVNHHSRRSGIFRPHGHQPAKASRRKTWRLVYEHDLSRLVCVYKVFVWPRACVIVCCHHLGGWSVVRSVRKEDYGDRNDRTLTVTAGPMMDDERPEPTR